MFTPSFITTEKQRGIFYALVAMMLFSCMAALCKHLTAHYSVYEVAFFRFFFALIPLIPLIVGQGGLAVFKTGRFKEHALRSCYGLGSLILYFYSLQHLPLADAVAVSFTNPIFITILSIIFLKEKIGLHRWTAIGCGFFGVVLISGAGDFHINIGVLFGLGSAILYAFAMMSIRALGTTEKVVTTSSYFTSLASLFLIIPAGLSWTPPTFIDFLLFLVVGLVAGTGQIFLTKAYQIAPPSVVAPFNYTSILWATLIGFAVFGHVPEMRVWIGSAIVIASGLYIIHREHVTQKRATSEETSFVK